DDNSSSVANILDDVELITALQQSKQTSSEIEVRVAESEKTNKTIDKEMSFYKPLAIRGSLLYFVIADLAKIDAMYQFSLAYFQQLFTESITSLAEENSETKSSQPASPATPYHGRQSIVQRRQSLQNQQLAASAAAAAASSSSS
ncbi:unnamed protein product, partial [Amoebophrya sp. A120]